jgi:hypothetical protein
MYEKYQEYKNKIVIGFTFYPIQTWNRFKKLFVEPPKIIAPSFISSNKNRKPSLFEELERQGELLIKRNNDKKKKSICGIS